MKLEERSSLLLAFEANPPRFLAHRCARLPGEAWTNLTTVTTNEYSQYSFQWTPETAGTYEVKALWPSDENTLSDESDVHPIAVQEPPPSTPSYLYMVAIVANGMAAISIAATLSCLRTRKRKTK